MGRLVSLSAVAIQPPSAIYREEQRFGWWIYALLALMMALAWTTIEGRGPVGPFIAQRHGLKHMVGVAVGFSLPVVLVVGVLRMTTLVTPTDVRIWFGFIPTYRRQIALASIAKVEVVVYRPIADTRGWGVRTGRDGEKVFNARGNRGVRLYLVDGSKVLIGSQRAEELALALEGVLRPGH
jgi:hypothetical protein